MDEPVATKSGVCFSTILKLNFRITPTGSGRKAKKLDYDSNYDLGIWNLDYMNPLDPPPSSILHSNSFYRFGKAIIPTIVP